MSGETCIRRACSASMAVVNGPQREPTTVISSITRGAKSKSNFDATVVLRTIVPLGLTNRMAVAKPTDEPVQSTTTLYLCCGVSLLTSSLHIPNR